MVSLIIDFSNLAHASFYASLNKRFAPEAVPLDYTDHIWSLADRIQKVITATGGSAKVYFVYDNLPKAKIAAFPEYKAGRARIEFPIIKTSKAGLQSWPVVHLEHPDYEADDVIASVIKKVENPVIVTTDKDLWQLASDALIYDHYKMSYVDLEMVQNAFDIHPEHIVLYKSLWGDRGDAIPNLVPRMQKHLLPVIRQTDGTLDNFWAEVAKASLSDRCVELLQLNKEGIRTNYELVRLNRNIFGEDDLNSILADYTKNDQNL